MKTKVKYSIKAVRFNTEGLAPVIVQEYKTGEVLTLAYANNKAVAMTLITGLATFWSRSRQKIWVKGEASGNLLRVMAVAVDCDGDALLYTVKLPKGGGACHKQDKKGNYRKSCFFRKLKSG